MAVCKKCGKKGLFLHVNAEGLCNKCATLIVPHKDSSNIYLTIPQESTQKSTFESKEPDSMKEENACFYFIDELTKLGWDHDEFKIEHRSENYTSLFYGINNILRIKISENVKWISIIVCNEDRKLLRDSPLFAHQENKNEAHWKSYFKDISDLHNYLEIVSRVSVCEYYGTRDALNEKEKSVCDYIINLFVSCGADIDKFYLYILANEFELLYHSPLGCVRFKVYAKRAGGYIYDSHFKEYRIKNTDYKYPFTELTDLDYLSKKYIPTIIENGESYTDKNEMKYYIHYKPTNN